MRTSRRFSAAAICAAAALAACGGGGDQQLGDRRAGSPIRCADPADSVLYQAVPAYIRQLTPRPVRFVMAPSGANALPSPARASLQQVGPTFIWPADTAMQQQVRAMLKGKGEFTTLLLTFDGMQRTSRDEAFVRFGGLYVGGEMDGRSAPMGTVTFHCEQARWRLDTARIEKTA